MRLDPKHFTLILLTILSTCSEGAANEIEYEDSAFKFQSTYIWQRKASFNTPYPDGQNSMGSGLARSYTMTTTG